MSASSGGPYVQLAVLCEAFIKGEQSHALSLINIVEGITVAGAEPQMPPARIGPPLKIIINLWAGAARGRYSLKLRPETPSGLQDDPLELGPVNFGTPGGGLGVDTIREMPEYELTEEGTYWFDVFLTAVGEDEGQFLTRIPFIISYQPTVVLRG
jgi:hypothetical protein